MGEPDVPKAATGRVGTVMIVLAWVLVLALMGGYFSGWLDELNNPNQQVRSARLQGDIRQIVLAQNRSGHYVATGRINGHDVTFLLDTGATAISVPSSVARDLGLKGGAPMQAQTANGVITTYGTRLDRVELGNIALHDVQAHINPHMQGEEILLGMSFLRKLEFTQRDGELTIRQYPNPS
jgi:aspartyl protease family protein